MLALAIPSVVNTFLSSLPAYEAAHWAAQIAWLLAASPSIAVALTKYPKAEGAWSTIAQLLNVVSVLTHKDSPGTVKLPFTQSQPPAVTTLKAA